MKFLFLTYSRLFLPFFLLIFILTPSFLFSTVYYVNNNSTSGDKWCTAVGNNANNGTSPSTPKLTISNLISSYALTGGDVVRIDRGTYAEAVTITGSDDGSAGNYVTFIGAGTSNTTISGNGSGVTLTFTGTMGYVQFREMTISTTASSTVYMNGNCDNNDFSSCTVTNGVSNNACFWLRGGADNNNFDSCTVTSSGSNGYAFYISNDGSITPDNNTISYCAISFSSSGIGIEIIGLSTSLSSGNIIKNNTITGTGIATGTYCIDLEEGSNSQIYKNNLRNGEIGVLLKNTNTSATNHIIHNNYFAGNLHGIVSCNNESGTSYFNSFYNGYSNMNFWTSGTKSFKNWNILNNIFYITTGSGYCLLYNTATASDMPATIDYNVYYTPGGGNYGYTTTTYSTFANWQNANHDSPAGTKGDENSTSGNPYYTNAASYNLDIGNSLSTALHRGTASIVASYPTDIYENARESSPSTPCSGANEAYVALPVAMIDYTVECDLTNRQAILKWKTASETNNDFFTVEKSSDFTSIERIGIVDGAASGNSIDIKNYQFTDRYVFNNSFVYYRLTQTDRDGHKTIFAWLPLSCHDRQNNWLDLYPNPIETKLQYKIRSEFEQQINVSITDLFGTNILSQSITINKGIFENEIDFSPIAPGVYFFNVQSGNSLITKKIVKQ